MAFDPCDVCSGCIPANIDDRAFHQMALVALCQIVAAIEGGGGLTEDVNISAYGGVATTLGQKLMAASIPVVFASDQSPLTVTGSVVQTPATVGVQTETFVASSGVGSVAAGAYSASISNVGVAAGTVLGVSVPPGATVNFAATYDPVTNIYKYLPAIAYDGTGTILNVLREGP